MSDAAKQPQNGDFGGSPAAKNAIRGAVASLRDAAALLERVEQSSDPDFDLMEAANQTKAALEYIYQAKGTLANQS
jgi:hypothetical protein